MRTPVVSSCLLIGLLLAATLFPVASVAAGCCEPGKSSAPITSPADDACANCCETDEPGDPAPDRGQDPFNAPDSSDCPDGCDCLRSCCGAATHVVTRRAPSAVPTAAPAGFLPTIPDALFPTDAASDLLRPPQL